MAEARISLGQDQFNCPICLDLLKDPVTIPCGHSYCRGCIKSCWDRGDLVGVYRCPQCRQTFAPRPVLGRNTLLAEIVEKLKTGLRDAPPADHYAVPGDVECDVCTGRKNKAVKSCLKCLASYCNTHLQPHYESPAFKKHKLIDAIEHLQEKICPRHEKRLELYCRVDQQLICYLCVIDEHNGHEIVSAAQQRTEKRGDPQPQPRPTVVPVNKREYAQPIVRTPVMTNGAEDARYSYFCRSPGWYECRDPNLMLKAMGNYPVIYSAARCNWSVYSLPGWKVVRPVYHVCSPGHCLSHKGPAL